MVFAPEILSYLTFVIKKCVILNVYMDCLGVLRHSTIQTATRLMCS